MKRRAHRLNRRGAIPWQLSLLASSIILCANRNGWPLPGRLGIVQTLSVAMGDRA